MGCDISTPSHVGRSDATAMQSLNTRLAKSLDRFVPAADNAKSPRPGHPVGWGVFNDERERTAFIRAACLVLSDNGIHDVNNLAAEIFYSRCHRGHAAQIAIMDDNVIAHAIVGQRYGETQRHAFIYLKYQIEGQLDIILRRSHKAVSKDDWDEPLARKVRMAPSRQSIQHKSSRKSIQHKPPRQSISHQTQKQTPQRASHQSVLPFDADLSESSEQQDLTDIITQLPAEKRRSLIASCASPSDINALYNIPESTAAAAQRRSAGYIPPVGSPAWESTRMSGPRPQRNDSSNEVNAVAKTSWSRELNADGSAARKAPWSGSLGMGSSNFALETLGREASGPLIGMSGRYGSSSTGLATNDALVWDHNVKEYRQHASSRYEMQVYQREALAKMESSGRPVGPGVSVQRQGVEQKGERRRSSGKNSGGSGSGGSGRFSPEVPQWLARAFS